MAKISTKQIQEINDKCSNEWRLDTQFYLFYGEKTLRKCIETDKEHYLEFILSYNSKNQITVRVSKFYHREGDEFATSSELGRIAIIDERSYKQKRIDNLIQLTQDLDNNKLLEINQNARVPKTMGII